MSGIKITYQQLPRHFIFNFPVFPIFICQMMRKLYQHSAMECSGSTVKTDAYSKICYNFTSHVTTAQESVFCLFTCDYNKVLYSLYLLMIRQRRSDRRWLVEGDRKPRSQTKIST